MLRGASREGYIYIYKIMANFFTLIYGSKQHTQHCKVTLSIKKILNKKKLKAGNCND